MELVTVKKLEMMLEFANLTEEGRETLRQAIEMLRRGNKYEYVKMAADRIEGMLQQLKEDCQKEKRLAPHVLTRGEIHTAKLPALVWIELRGSRLLFPVEMTGIQKDFNGDVVVVFSDGNEDYMKQEGTIFRLWSDKPTEAERECVPWNEPEAEG